VLDRAKIMREPLELENQQQSPTDPDTQRENERSRVEDVGPGAELFRRVRVAELRAHFEAFCEHGSIVDIFVLATAFDLIERVSPQPATCLRPEATLVESFLTVLGLSPEMLLRSVGAD
jgi:hypothetical protein